VAVDFPTFGVDMDVDAFPFALVAGQDGHGGADIAQGSLSGVVSG
jgi:hypothetical protein